MNSKNIARFMQQALQLHRDMTRRNIWRQRLGDRGRLTVERKEDDYALSFFVQDTDVSAGNGWYIGTVVFNPLDCE